MPHDSQILDVLTLRNTVATPFDALKTATQHSQFAIDPSKGLTRRRYGYYSNNTLFDETLISEDDANGVLNITTTATSTDTARLRSALAGQYVSQSLAQPGIGIDIANANATVDANNHASISHGTIGIGAGWHDGTSGGWGVNPGPIQTFLGLTYTSTGTNAVLISNGQHLADSPVPQSEWNIDPMDGTGPSQEVLDPSSGYIYNMPYTWYGYGALYVGIIHPQKDHPLFFHKFTLDQASLDRPNIAPMVVVDNQGTASSLNVNVGGMQYALYGAQVSEEGGEERATETTRVGLNVATAVVTANNAVDMNAEPGVPVVAFKREPPVRDLSLRLDELVATPDAPVWLFSWDEYDPATALTGANFRDPYEPVTPETETNIVVDTEATDYTPTLAVARGMDYVYTDKNTQSLEQISTDDRIPIDATRVITAVHAGTSATINPAQIRIVEGY